ncbi:FH1/FH2 domain-containing protein 1-like, partial [Scleropages formosus]
MSPQGKKPILILRTQLSVRVHSILGFFTWDLFQLGSMCTDSSQLTGVYYTAAGSLEIQPPQFPLTMALSLRPRGHSSAPSGFIIRGPGLVLRGCEKLYNSNGPELRRSLFSLKQLFQDDKDLVPEFVNSEGLTCFIKVGAEADQNYQNYILRALSQIMLFVDGMNGVIQHNETLQWLYTLCGSLSRLVVKTALKLLIVFVEYIDSNSPLLIQAVGTVDSKRGVKPWTYLMDILEEKNCSDSELLVYTVSLINKTLAALPDQDSFYDVTDCLEELGMERIMQKHMSSKGTEADLKQQLAIYENALRFEDGEVEEPHPNTRRERRKGALNAEEGRRSRRSSFNNLVDGSVTLAVPPPSSPRSPELHASTTLPPVSGGSTAPATPPSPTNSVPLEEPPPLPDPQPQMESRGALSLEACTMNLDKPVLRKFKGTFLRNLEATQWEHRKKQSSHGKPSTEETAEEPEDLASNTVEPTSNTMEPTSNISVKRWTGSDQPSAQGRHHQEARDPEPKLSFLPSEQPEVKEEAHDEPGVKRQGSVAEQRRTLSRDRKFMLDMLYARSPSGSLTSPSEEQCPEGGRAGDGDESPSLMEKKQLFLPRGKVESPQKAELESLGGRAKAAKARLAEEQQGRAVRPQCSIDAEMHSHNLETTLMMPLSRDSKGAEVKKSEILVLDPKRSNAINIGMTVLPSINIIKNAILTFDEFAITKEGIEKILTMMPSDEEKQRIQEAQLANPDVPLGSAEKFLFTLSSISALSARLQLWAFRLNYETLEKEVAEPLFDLKLGMEQLAMNTTFKRILATLLAIGNFLNGSNAKGFELSYLDKVTEVKDTVHRQSLLYHTCHVVVEKYPETSDMYSEIPAITRSAKVDFEQLSDNLVQLERKCKSSWDNLKVMAKHEAKAELKNKMTEFLKDCTERIIILKVVHRRIINRFHSFLLYLGQPSYSVRDIKVTQFCKIISEFSLEYRTTRERVLTQKRKRAAHRERTKTRGKMITEGFGFYRDMSAARPPKLVNRQDVRLMFVSAVSQTEKFSAAVSPPPESSPAPVWMTADLEPSQEEHENMKNLLTARVDQGIMRRSRAVK